MTDTTDMENPTMMFMKRMAALGAMVVLCASATALQVKGQDKGQDKGKDPKQEEKVEKAELGKPAPGFELKTVEGKTVKLADHKGKTVVLEWFNPSCPYCAYAYGKDGPLSKLPEELQAKGVVWLSIVSEKPENSGGQIETIKKFMEQTGMKVPILLDPDGKVGKIYGAKSTPHMFVISERGALVYRGALDTAPFGKVGKDDARINYVEAAIADLSSGRAVIKAETKSYG